MKTPTLRYSHADCDSSLFQRKSLVAAVDAVWHWYGSSSAGCETIEADGCADIIVRRNELGAHDVSILGPTLAAHQATVKPQETVIGIRLKSAWGGQLFSRASTFHQATTQLIQRGAFENLANEVECLVGNLFESSTPPALVLDFLSESEEKKRFSLSNLSSAEERRLERACWMWIGTSPKRILRVQRIRRAKMALKEGGPIIDVALDLGFSDQAHLTRESRLLLGKTPKHIQMSEIFKTATCNNDKSTSQRHT